MSILRHISDSCVMLLRPWVPDLTVTRYHLSPASLLLTYLLLTYSTRFASLLPISFGSVIDLSRTLHIFQKNTGALRSESLMPRDLTPPPRSIGTPDSLML